MTRTTLARIVEAFFRLWPLLIIPAVVSVVIGIGQASQVRSEYTSSGSLLIDPESLVTLRSGVEVGDFFSFLSPAQFASQELSGLLATDAFTTSVIESADIELPSDPTVAGLEVSRVREAIFSVPNSENLISIGATTFDPEEAQRLASATIDEFLAFQIQSDVAESEAAERFFETLAETYLQDLTDARAEVDSFLVGVVDIEAMPAERQQELVRLRDAETVAQAQYAAALEDLEATRLAALQAETDVRQSLALVDAPQVPRVPTGDLLDRLIIVVSYAIVGLLLTIAATVAMAMGNRTVQFADDLSHLGDTRVIAVIPRSAKAALRTEDAPIPDVVDMAPLLERKLAAPSPRMADEDDNPIQTLTPKAATSGRSGRWERAGAAPNAADADDATVTGLEARSAHD